ncbi:MAG: chemotaxis protein CheC [Candidatus Omnitrophota bacterium]|nr:chemotaxis protein CheC [Candidatus Omnitrophota bacterium]MBU1929483.1 chemotaxis protein CheC [Candidatus Omnitrophota bacterium]MBU2034944.1 chemotaxis protein CheC [Candidatus Omnitrophota bacterium]MBU2221055.1 chemotaxis protein CheC [Candidatus Omnitrophota bacterium]MBU2258887.1 chemotaxis protein CheC [Candidatus Omnitrophota bacterium]
MTDIILSESQKDALEEIGNICSGNAATALSQLLFKKIDIVVPRILLVRLEDVPMVVGGPDTLVAGLILKVLGDLPSHILFIFSQKDALTLASFMTGKKVTETSILGGLETSALKEIGLILASSYLGALGSFMGMGLVPAVPELIVDMAGSMIDYILIELSSKSEFALLIESEFKEPQALITGHFFLIPNASALEAILKAIK